MTVIVDYTAMNLDDQYDFPMIALGTGIVTKRGICVGTAYLINTAEDVVRRLNLEWMNRQVRAPSNTLFSDRGEPLVDLVERRNGQIEVRSHSPTGWARE